MEDYHPEDSVPKFLRAKIEPGASHVPFNIYMH